LSAEEEIREAVDEAKAPGKFNILDVLKDRGYPETELVIYLDEKTAYEASLWKEKLDELDKKNSDSKAVTEKREVILEKIEEYSETLKKSSLTFHLRGIPEGKREELFAEARKKYPIQYESENDLKTLLGQQGERREKPSPERDALFTDFLWQQHIQKIVDPDGNEQTEFPFAAIKEMRNSLPLSAMVKINEAIEKLRTSSAVFMMETGEDFLAKP